MRQVSLKRAKLNRSVAKFREGLKTEVGRCEHCRKLKAPEYLDCDEISRGATRAKSLTARFAILCVCRTCHRIIQDWSRAKRLALLYLARSSDYDLEKFWALTGRRFPDQESVDIEIARLTR